MVGNPEKEIAQHDGRIRRWASIREAEGWFLRVVLLPDREDTDTLYIEFRQATILETKDLDENTILDLDREGNICAITIEHAREHTQIPSFSYEQVTA